MENKKNNKAILDWIITAIVLVVFVVCYFFWGCNMDLWITIVGAVILVAGTVLVQLQNKKIKKAKEA